MSDRAHAGGKASEWAVALAGALFVCLFAAFAVFTAAWMAAVVVLLAG
jgi:hypothetical protein